MRPFPIWRTEAMEGPSNIYTRAAPKAWIGQTLINICKKAQRRSLVILFLLIHVDVHVTDVS